MAELNSPVPTVEGIITGFHSRSERIARGKQLRERLPRKVQADWHPRADRRDPVEVLEQSNRGRIPELIPIRYGRMLHSPFTFLRGSAGLMAYDLSTLPHTGIAVQACGDCHLLNFGLFATPERNLVFDINDFDETLPAPWEWDLKRLAVSCVVAGRDQGLTDDDAADAVRQCVRSYRQRLREYSRMSPVEVWYSRLDVQHLVETAPNEKIRKRREEMAGRARERVVEAMFPEIVCQAGGRYRFVDRPPLLYHANTGSDLVERWLAGLEAYRQSMSDDRRVLFDRYRFEDAALKVVGIGSVGTRCGIALFFSEENHPLILQVKEAVHSVLEPYLHKSRYAHQGERVVMGQRLMQSSSDIFLGWSRGAEGQEYYVRQLRDMKFSVPLEHIDAADLARYADLCAWALARAHAKSGDSATISGYLGKKGAYDEALAQFARAYADQNEQDYNVLVAAERSGKVRALREEDL